VRDLAGKVAVITGAASGIGLAMARRFGAEGMHLVLADIERPALACAAEQLAADLSGLGVEVIAVPTDTSVRTDVEALAAAAFERFDDVHLLCNNAGVGSRGLTIADLPLADFEWVLAVNLFGVIHGVRAFLPHLRANDVGHIVNTAYSSGLYHLPRMGPYNASKAAVVALSETLRFELAAEGSHVGVSVLCPSWVRTNLSTADRNRPERYAYELDTDQMAEVAEYKSRRRAVVGELAIDAAEVADQVCAAVLEDRFYIVTHRQSLELFAERANRIMAGQEPQAPR
jgi:NAD(P)-dependent dehydrogenase (short-subunit alcohol dehydrogenase family)